MEMFSDALDADGRPKRSHLGREIIENEADVARRIFDLCGQVLPFA